MKKLILPALCLSAIAFFVYQFFLATPLKPALTYQWNAAPQAILSDFDGAHDPKLAVDTKGDLTILAVGRNPQQSQLQTFTSQDKGSTFASGTPVSQKSVPLDSHGENAPIFVKTAGNPLVLWGQKNAAGGSDIVVAHSNDDENGFSKPIRINDGTPRSSAYLGHFAASPKVLLAAWLDGRDGAKDGTTSLYSASSIDNGKTWQKNVRIAKDLCPCCRPDVVILPNGKIVVAWRNVFPGQIRDMASAVSNDNGKTWSEPRRIAADNWQINGCPETGPRLAIIGNRIFATWFSKGTGKDAGIRFTWSDDAGASWQKPTLISKGLKNAGHPDIFANKENVYLTFRADDPVDKSIFKAYMTLIQKDGKITFSEQVPGSDAAAFPSIVSDGNGDIWVAWNGMDKVWLTHAQYKTS